MIKRLLLIFAFLAVTFTSAFAEPRASITMQNMHLWRGGEIADGFVVTTDVCYTDSLRRFKIGFWGGTNSTGDYKEFDYYVSVAIRPNLSVTIFDTYNFSTYATYNHHEFFNYKINDTGRFIDATVRYRLEGDYPLALSWATVIFGRDRDEESSANRYSTFCSAEYPIYSVGQWRIDLGVGAAFALNNIDDGANFYGSEAGVVETTLRVTNELQFRSYTLPVSVTAMWNPQSSQAYLQLSATVLAF